MLSIKFSSALKNELKLNQLCLHSLSRRIHTSCVAMKTIRLSDLPPKRERDYLYIREGPGPRGDPRKRIKRLDMDMATGGHHKIPFDPKLGYLVSPKEVHPSKWGGDQEVMERISKDPARYGHAPGYYDKHGKFVLVPEMIPEFVVPDLSECSLRPYVNYQLEGVGEDELTPLQLFKATYGSELMSVRADMTPKDLDIYLDDFLAKHSQPTAAAQQQREQQTSEQSGAT